MICIHDPITAISLTMANLNIKKILFDTLFFYASVLLRHCFEQFAIVGLIMILTHAAMKTSLLGIVDSRQDDPVFTEPHFLTITASLAPKN